MPAWLKTHPWFWIAIGYFAFYLPCFFLLERFSVPKYTIHCPLDDLIPFCEYFLVPYFLWFFLLAWALIFFAARSRADFLRLCFLMFTGMTICLALYVLFPNGLELRPAVTRDNLFCRVCRLLYAVDTPTNVCPSIHVASTAAVQTVAERTPLFRGRPAVRLGLLLLGTLICLSTVFLKQHSVVDAVCGIALTLLLSGVLLLFERVRRNRLARAFS